MASVKVRLGSGLHQGLLSTWHLNALAGAKSAERAKASAAAYSLVTATGRPVLVILGSAQMLLAAAEPWSLPFIFRPFPYDAILQRNA